MNGFLKTNNSLAGVLLQFMASIFLVSHIVGAMGCSGPDEAGAESFLEGQQMLVMRQNDRAYGLNALGKELTPEIAEQISALRGLKNLDLARCKLTNETLSTATGPLNLVSIVLSDTNVEDAALQSIAGHSRMEAVFLANTGVTDAGLKQISALWFPREIALSSASMNKR